MNPETQNTSTTPYNMPLDLWTLYEASHDKIDVKMGLQSNHDGTPYVLNNIGEELLMQIHISLKIMIV